MTPHPTADTLLARMAELDRTIATAQAEQAALWLAIRRVTGTPGNAIGTILDAVAAEFRVPRLEIMSDRRHAAVIAARHAVCWLARHLTPMSYPQIARALKRDHTTIMHSVQAADLRITRDGQFAQQLATLQAELAGRLVAPTPAQEAA
jgi:chromosomal replication initiation ATPase DnaA